MGVTRRGVIAGLLTWSGMLALCEKAVAARRPKVVWSRDTEGRFLVIADCKPDELVSSVLARYGGTWETAEDYLEPDYVTEVRFGAKVLRSTFWDRNGGDYAPPPGTRGLVIQYGRLTRRKKWVPLASTIESAILKSHVPEGMALRVGQVGYDDNRVDNPEWNIARRVYERAKVASRVAAAEMQRFARQWV